MKKKTSIILMIVGVALIIFGALIPTIFSGGNKDTFTYNRKSISSYYYCHVYVTTEEDYQITNAAVTLRNAFDEHDKITKTIEYSDIDNALRSKEDDKYVFTLTLHLTSSEYFNYTEVESVTLTTSIGQRTAEEKEMLSSFSWKIPVMVITIFIGVAITMTGIAMIASIKLQRNLAEKTRKELAQSNPEINTSNMSDAEVLAKQRELRLSKFKEDIGFVVEQKPKEKVCEYCGATNSAEANKCSSCGANLKTKK